MTTLHTFLYVSANDTYDPNIIAESYVPEKLLPVDTKATISEVFRADFMDFLF